MPWRRGDRILIADLAARLIAPLESAPRLWFVAIDGDVRRAMERSGAPIRYAYLTGPAPPLAAYQTIFARVPGGAEMPSAGRPFSARVLRRLRARGVGIARVLLHAGVSSLDLQDGSTTGVAFPEPFRVPPAAAAAVERTRRRGGRVVAVGTTVVRALESAAHGAGVRAAAGYTRVMIGPGRGGRVVDGLLTGFHTEGTSHLALLAAIGGAARVRDAYEEALAEEYLWHEFGDVHLLWKPGRPGA
jgi:S-adenosylmethionine:tRNA ribosyltransferase-isomerase